MSIQTDDFAPARRVVSATAAVRPVGQAAGDDAMRE